MLDPTRTGEEQLVWSTYLGGSNGEEYPNGLAVSESGEVTVCGTTGSTLFPTTPGALSTSFGGGFWDGFVARFDPTLSGEDQLLYATFVGDARTDIAYAITETPDGRIIVTGRTDSPDFPTLGAIQPNLAGTFDSYLLRLSVR